ncbi:S8 family serine peptidase [Ruficoccus amylovorans]|uniref:S8 family serine peptidase n=1 Tax=Ruficoccus amylovorans TaxID=1804625 RepID=A0A842H9W1_9BACT|nr:S8 family serine peptidase [Ruficoccus amylovorans]MBC2593283.1 S8 family serine peptidase [Ruficoccus amylovorans]
MKKALSLTAALLLLTLSAWVAWSLGRSSREAPSGPSALQPEAVFTPNADTGFSPAVSTAPSTPAGLATPDYPPPPPGAIRGEVALVFDSQAEYQQALAWLREQGIDILNTLPGLNAIRIGTTDPAWKRLGASPGQVGYNFPIAPPPPVGDSPYLNAANLGFGETVLSFLGVPEPDPRWGQGVTVAVLDSGVMSDHVNLEDARILSPERVGQSDPVGHGTAVASLIAGQDSPVLGLAAGTTILSLPVLNDDGLSDTFRVSAAVVQAVDLGARVISMSLGAYGDSAVLRQAIKYAREHGVVLVASVGNDGAGQVAYPAAYDGVLAVAAVDALSQPASFSNYGPQVDIAAPGVQVPVAWTGDRFASVSGTSFSTPLVAAAVALVLQQDPRLSGPEAVRVVLDNANDAALPGKDEFTGEGVLNIERILERNRRGVFDAAVASYNLPTEPLAGADNQIDITVENRGTEYLSQVQLNVQVGEQRESYFLGALKPGEIATQPVPVSTKLLSAGTGVEIRASVSINGEDSHPANDSRTETLLLQTAE